MKLLSQHASRRSNGVPSARASQSSLCSCLRGLVRNTTLLRNRIDLNFGNSHEHRCYETVAQCSISMLATSELRLSSWIYVQQCFNMEVHTRIRKPPALGHGNMESSQFMLDTPIRVQPCFCVFYVHIKSAIFVQHFRTREEVWVLVLLQPALDFVCLYRGPHSFVVACIAVADRPELWKSALW